MQIFIITSFLAEVPAGIIAVRVAYSRAYHVVIAPELVQHYSFDVNQTNDINEEIFLAVRERSTYVQLIAYEVTGIYDCQSEMCAKLYLSRVKMSSLKCPISNMKLVIIGIDFLLVL